MIEWPFVFLYACLGLTCCLDRACYYMSKLMFSLRHAWLDPPPPHPTHTHCLSICLDPNFTSVFIAHLAAFWLGIINPGVYPWLSQESWGGGGGQKNISGREELNRWFMGDLGRWRGFCSVLCNYEGNHQITISLVYFCRCAGMYLFDCVRIRLYMSVCVCEGGECPTSAYRSSCVCQGFY